MSKLLLQLTIKFAAILCILQCQAFAPRKTVPRNSRMVSSSVKMTSETGYGPVGSLLRQGPVPFFIRIAKPDTYESAVVKYMALEKCDRVTAQANMDAYFQDPNGWAGSKLKAKKTGLDLDRIYVNANMDYKSLVLTGVWASVLFALISRIFYVQMLQSPPPL